MQQLGGFPKLGVERRQESPIINGDQQANTKAKQIGWHLRQAAGMDSSPESKEDTDYWGHETVAGSHGAQVTTKVPVTTGFVHSNENIAQRFPKKPLSPNSDLATQLHEDFHHMMGRIEQKHGVQARQNLAYNLWHSIPLHGTAHHYDYGAYMAGNLPDARRPEEAIASLHNYLNDPAARDEYHSAYGHGDVTRQSAHDQMKQAFKHLQRMTKKADIRWMKRRYSMKELQNLVHDRPPITLPEGAKPEVAHQKPKAAENETLRMEKSEDLQKLAKRVLDPSLGYTIRHNITTHVNPYELNPSKRRYHILEVSAHSPDGTKVGNTIIGDNDVGLEASNTFVHPEHRRRGLASAMYAHAEKLMGKKMLPSRSQTLDGQALWSGTQGEFAKHEEDDEGMRLLAHPNRDERRMALKLGTINDRHLMRAFYDEDPSIQMDALHHPAMSHESLMALMHMPQSEAMQLLGMKHKLFNREHLKALYDHHAQSGTPAVMDAVTASDKLYPELMERMYADGNASRSLLARTDVPASIVRAAIEKHFVPGHNTKGPERYLTIEALKSPHAPHDLVEQAIKNGDEGIQLAAAKSPGLRPDIADDILKRGHVPNAPGAFLRSALARSPFATEKHLDTALEDHNPLVRAAVFSTESPLLKQKHVDRAIEKGHLHDILVALKSKAANPGHLSKLAQHKDPKIQGLYTAYQQKDALKKYEAELGTFLKKNNLQEVDPNSDIVRDMLGYNHNLLSTFEAAKFLIAGNAPSLDQVRRSLWQADGDPEKAALLAYGLDVNDGNLRALRAIRDLKEHKKAEPVSEVPQDILPGVAEASKAAESVQRAYQDRFVFPVKLGGKHSEGTLLARDNVGGHVYLLKPGSGPISPAAGDAEEAASQSRREAGFWHVADDWGLGDYLPRTDLILINNKEYACMELLPWKYKTLDKLKKDDESLPQKLLGPYLKSGALHKWAVLDYVLGNPDRHANNLMADDTGDTPHADVKLIDHGSAMAGDDFDPANDQNSFVPYYLRAWVIGPFNSLSVTDKLKVMPRVDDHMADELHDWVSHLHAHELGAQLLRYGVNPEPAIARLAKLKVLMSQEPVDLAINKLWVTT